MADFMELQNRLKIQGWRFCIHTLCGHGHMEAVYENKDFPGVFIKETCIGNLETLSGEIKPVTRMELIEG